MADVIAPENEEGTKATILRWCKAAGEAIRKDEPLLELETDKVTVEVPSPASGELAEILKQPNEEVQPGQILARIRIAGADAAAAEPVRGARLAPSAAPSPAGGDRAAAGEPRRAAASRRARALAGRHRGQRAQRTHHGAGRGALPRRDERTIRGPGARDA